MRFAGQARLGYYPTPPSIADSLAQACQPSQADQPWTVCDPFCGPGDALMAFNTPHRYGIELDDTRAQQATMHPITVIHGNAFDVTLPARSLSVLFLNPPYNHDPIANTRVECLALNTFTPAVAIQGLVLLIFPLVPLHVYRFPDPEFAAFHQIVLIAQRIPHPVDAPSDPCFLYGISRPCRMPPKFLCCRQSRPHAPYPHRR